MSFRFAEGGQIPPAPAVRGRGPGGGAMVRPIRARRIAPPAGQEFRAWVWCGSRRIRSRGKMPLDLERIAACDFHLTGVRAQGHFYTVHARFDKCDTIGLGRIDLAEGKRERAALEAKVNHFGNQR